MQFAKSDHVAWPGFFPTGVVVPIDAALERRIEHPRYIELLRTDVQKSKVQVMGEVMRFDADEPGKFWPIYKEFQTELAKLGNSVSSLVKTYAANDESMTDEIANQLASKLLDIEQERTALKRKYYERFKTTLDAVTAARFLQVENQLERVKVMSLTFTATSTTSTERPAASLPRATQAAPSEHPAVVIPAGTQINVITIDAPQARRT